MPALKSKLQDSEAKDFPGQKIQKFTIKPESDHIALLFADDVVFGILRDNFFKSLSPFLHDEKSLVLEGIAATDLICERLSKINKS